MLLGTGGRRFHIFDGVSTSETAMLKMIQALGPAPAESYWKTRPVYDNFGHHGKREGGYVRSA